MDKYWSFRKIVAIEELVFDNVLERFYKLGIQGLVRENIQNSLDGKLHDLEEPVYVNIETGNMDISSIPGIEEIKEHIKNLEGGNEYTKETIRHMQQSINKTNIPYISFEDYNTKGLSGAEHGENFKKGDTWGVYAYKKGMHHIEKDTLIESSRGGSHGVGKIACNAASDIHMMFFANCDAENKCYIGGTIQLIEHTIGNENYRSTGYFTKVVDDVYYPFENNFNDVFKKNTRGLKTIIPYLREQFQGNDSIIRAVCDNFWLSILRQELIVKVNDIVINADTIKNIVKDVNIYEEQNYEEIRKNFTPLYIDTYLHEKPSVIQISDKSNAYKFYLYMLYDERIKKGRLAIIRGIGMKIEDKKIKSYVNAPFNAVLIPVSAVEDIFLKSLENESHTQLSSEHIKNSVMQANAQRFINNITNELQKIISAVLKEAAPSDGAIDTSDLIYSVENNFKKELSKEISTVQLSKGSKQKEKTVVKVKSKSKQNRTTKTKKIETNGIRNIIRKVLKRENPNTEKETIRYMMYPESVKRIVLKNKEILSLDFTNAEQYSGEKSCDISLLIIDGTGKVYDAEFDINSNYSKIYDKNANKICEVSKNMIKDVTIESGRVTLEMTTTDKFNSSLKFMYYVEV